MVLLQDLSHELQRFYYMYHSAYYSRIIINIELYIRLTVIRFLNHLSLGLPTYRQANIVAIITIGPLLFDGIHSLPPSVERLPDFIVGISP